MREAMVHSDVPRYVLENSNISLQSLQHVLWPEFTTSFSFELSKHLSSKDEREQHQKEKAPAKFM